MFYIQKTKILTRIQLMTVIIIETTLAEIFFEKIETSETIPSKIITPRIEEASKKGLKILRCSGT